MANESTKWLYERLKSYGYNVGKDLGEFENLLKTNPQSRQWAFDTAKKSGLNVGKDINEFTALVAPPASAPKPAPKPEQKPTQPATVTTPNSTNQPAAKPQVATKPQPAAVANSTNQPAVKQESVKQQPTAPVSKPTPQAATKPQAKPVAKPVVAQPTLPSVVAPITHSADAKEIKQTEIPPKLGEQKAVSNENPVKVPMAPAAQPTPTSGMPKTATSMKGLEYYRLRRGGSDFIVSTADIQAAGGLKGWADKHPGAPLRVYMSGIGKDGKPFNGHVSIDEVDKRRSEQGFRYNLTNSTSYPEQTAEYQQSKHIEQILDKLWGEAESKTKKDVEAISRSEMDNYITVGGGREMKVVTAGAISHGKQVAALRNFDIDKMAQNAVNRLSTSAGGGGSRELTPKEKQEQEKFFKKVYNQVYNYALAKNAPKSTLEFFMRKVMDMNVIASLTKGLARSSAGVGDSLIKAEEQAIESYGKKHPVVSAVGTGVGVLVDPTTVVSSYAGGQVARLTMAAGGKIIAPKLATPIATRLFASTAAGKVSGALAGSIGNMATFEAIKEAERQFKHGGRINAETGEVEDYSLLSIAKAAGHGALLGTAMSIGGQFIGNVANTAVKATSSTAGKVGVRASEVGASALFNGTIFATDGYLQTGEMDLLNGVMTDLIGFKGVHAIKTAPARIASMRPIQNPQTMAERNHNRMSFEEHLRRMANSDEAENNAYLENLRNNIQNNHSNVFSKEEREILDKYGYGDLAKVFEKNAKPMDVKADNANDVDVERVEPEEIPTGSEFDGYDAMGRLSQDARVPETIRAKAYYIFTGKSVPVSTVIGYHEERNNKDGVITVNSVNANGGIVTSRRFKDEKQAEAERNNIMRQAELNTIDMGERYADNAVKLAVMHDVKEAVAQKWKLPVEAIENIYGDFFEGKNLSEAEMQIVNDVHAFGQGLESRHTSVTAAGIKEDVQSKHHVDLESIIRKTAGERSKAEQDAITEYAERLYSEVDRQRMATDTFAKEASEMRSEHREEQRRAWRMQAEGRLLAGKLHDGNPQEQEQARVDIEAINLRVDEARQMCEEALGEDAEYWMNIVNENPWATVLNPTLSDSQRDAILYYINSKATQDGVLSAQAEAAESQRAEIENRVRQRTHKYSGMIEPAIMKLDDRNVYVVSGEVVMFSDGSAVDHEKSTESLIIWDPQADEYQFASPEDILRVEDKIDPQTEIDAAVAQAEALAQQRMAEEQAARQQWEAAERKTFEGMSDEKLLEYIEQYENKIAEIKRGNPSNTSDIEYIEQVVSRLRIELERRAKERSNEPAEVDAAPAQPAPAENAQSETTQPEESTPAPAESAQPEAAPQEQPAPEANPAPEPVAEPAPAPSEPAPAPSEPAPVPSEPAPVPSEPAVPEQPRPQEQPATAMSRLPVDESGRPVFEKATPEDVWNALVEQTKGNKDAARTVAAKQAEQAQADVERLQKETPTTTEAELSGDPMAMVEQMNANNAANERAQAEHQAKLAEAQRKAEFWAQVGKVEGDRAAMETERQHAEREAEEQRIKAEQDAERQRAEREAEEQRAKAQEEERQREAEDREYFKVFSDEELLEAIERYENQIAETKRDKPWDTPGIRYLEWAISKRRTELERRAKERAKAEQEDAARAQESEQPAAEANERQADVEAKQEPVEETTQTERDADVESDTAESVEVRDSQLSINGEQESQSTEDTQEYSNAYLDEESGRTLYDTTQAKNKDEFMMGLRSEYAVSNIPNEYKGRLINLAQRVFGSGTTERTEKRGTCSEVSVSQKTQRGDKEFLKELYNVITGDTDGSGHNSLSYSGKQLPSVYCQSVLDEDASCLYEVTYRRAQYVGQPDMIWVTKVSYIGDGAGVPKSADAVYSITPTTYTNKKGKTSDVHLVKFNRELTREEKSALDSFVREPLADGKKTSRGWYDRNEGGYMMRSEEAARQLGEMIADKTGEAVADALPLSKEELKEATTSKKGRGKKTISVVKPDFFSSTDDFLCDKQSLFTFYRDDVQRNYGGITYVASELGTSVFHMSIKLGVAAGLLPRRFAKYYGRTKDGLIELDDAQEVIDAFEELGIHSPKELIEFIDNNSKKPANRANIDEVMAEQDVKPTAEQKPTKEGRKLVITDEMKADEDILRDLLGIDDSDMSDNVLLRDGGDTLTPAQKRKVFAAGVNYALGYIDQGFVGFDDFATAMTQRLGSQIKPWLKSFYEGAKRIPGYEDMNFTPTEDVDRFDVDAIGKPSSRAVDKARQVVAEQEAKKITEQANKELKEERNKKRKERDEQTTANTVATAEKAGSVASEASRAAETSEDANELQQVNEKIDESLSAIADNLALLGFYEAEKVDSDYSEAYGYMRNAEKKAIRDAARLTRQLIADLGIDADKVRTYGSSANNKKFGGAVVYANITPAGGELNISLPLNDMRLLSIQVGVKPQSGQDGNLEATYIMYRVDKLAGGGRGEQRYADKGIKYGELLDAISKEIGVHIRREEPSLSLRERVWQWLDSKELIKGWNYPWAGDSVAKEFGIPKEEARALVKELKAEWQAQRDADMKALADMAERGESPYTVTPEVQSELAKQKEADVKSINGYKIGDEVMYDRSGKGKWEKYKITDFDSNGRPILDSFGVSFISEVANWDRIKPANGVFGEAERVANVDAEKREFRRKAIDFAMNEFRSDRALAGNFDMYMKKFGKDHNPDSKGKVDALTHHKPFILNRIATRMCLDGMFESYDEAKEYVEKELFKTLEHKWNSEGPFDIETFKKESQAKKGKPQAEEPEKPLSEAMADFYSDKLFNEDAIGNMGEDDAVDLYIIDVLNPNLSDNSPKTARENLRKALKKVSDAKLYKLWEEYGNKPGATSTGRVLGIEQLNRTVFAMIDDERVSRMKESDKALTPSDKPDITPILETLRSGKPAKRPKNPVKTEDSIDGVLAGEKKAKAFGGSLGNVEEIEEAPTVKTPEKRSEKELAGNSAQYQEKEAQTVSLVNEISSEIAKRVESFVSDPDNTKPLTMTDIKRIAAKYYEHDKTSDTDLQELVELAMTQLTRRVAMTGIAGSAESQREAYDKIVNLYRMQPSLNARDSERLIKQQYSTPTPFGYVMGQFAKAGGKAINSMLEPSAGNGALTIAIDPYFVHVNDIDKARLANLRKLGFGKVTAQDALTPFNLEYLVDLVMTNPPFGTVAERIYDDIFRISSLEGQMAINALDSMKDNGRAAIIIGGNTNYRENGSMNPKDAAFFGYLYSHYNVVDVINISGKALYSRNGTGYDVRMILIDGRKTGEFERVFPPVKAKARAEQVKTFDELYKRVQDDIQQIQQVGNLVTDVQREAKPTADGKQSAPVRSGNNTTNSGAGVRPDSTGNVERSPSRTNSGQSSSENVGSRPSRVDNANGRDAGSSNDVQRPATEQSRSIGNRSVENERGGSGGNRRVATPARPDGGTKRLAVKPNLNTEKVPYPNQSNNGDTLMSVVPAAQAEVLKKSLSEIGDVDRYLVDELGYSSENELYDCLAAEQIDSVALAIHQMNNGNAFIIGDMTGVGKGRQGAALIRYARKHGKIPIYFTQKPTLFTDNYRDLSDIGSGELRPFIIASKPKDASIVDEKGNIIHKLPSKKEQDRVFNHIMQTGSLPDEYDFVLTTYDQIKNGTCDYEPTENGEWNITARKLPKKSKGYTAADNNGQVRRDVLARLAQGNIVILDESHTVGGDSGCGRFMQMLTSQAGGVTFLSATFAKRADNMPIYAQRTAISAGGIKTADLIEAVASGGVTLQEIMSKQLVESGQMIRRERSFDGVNIDWLPVDEGTNIKQREQFDEVSEIFDGIRRFQDEFVKPIFDKMNEEAAEVGATVGVTQGTEALGVKNAPFASKMYNLVNQLLFALKVDAVADRVVENLRNGYKPVISFTNTMEGFLKEVLKDGEMDHAPNFSITLIRALNGVLRYTTKDADANTEGSYLSLDKLSGEGLNAYNALKEKIMNLSADLPISPVDAIRMKLEDAGYSVAEISGRDFQLNRTNNGKYVVEVRKKNDNKDAIRDFNSGKLDVLMINKSGSTGISLHASSRFNDQRQRVMVFAQFQVDINDEVQMRGRIDRSGQVMRGRYEYIMSTIPAEQRIQMMFKAKLKSLDANTTSSQKSKFNEMEIVDYLNKYGDEVVWEYMKDHPELVERLGDPLKMLKEGEENEAPRVSGIEDASNKEGCAAKVSRYLAFLPVDEQDKIFNEITDNYRVKIQLLDDAGENDLEITTMPLRAESKRRQIWHKGVAPDSGNAFADNTYVEEVEVDVLKKPMTRKEITDTTRKYMGELYTEKNGEADWSHYAEAKYAEVKQFYQAKVDDAMSKMQASAEAKIAKEHDKAVKKAIKERSHGNNNFSDEEIQSLANAIADEVRQKEVAKLNKRREEILQNQKHIGALLQRLRAGQIYVVPTDLKNDTPETFSPIFGTFVGFKFNKDFTLGSSTAIFATLDGRRKVELALNQIGLLTIIKATENARRYSPKEIGAINMGNWDSRVPTETRQKRYIITGNLLQALVDTGKGEKTKGNLISYSTIDGEIRQGILMGENFKPADLRNSAKLSSRLPQILKGEAVVSEDGDVTIEWSPYGYPRGSFELRVPKSKQRGGIYSMNPELLKLVEDRNFVTKGNHMVGRVTPDNIARVVDMLSREPFNLTVLEESQLTDADKPEATGDYVQRTLEDGEDSRGVAREAELNTMEDKVNEIAEKLGDTKVTIYRNREEAIAAGMSKREASGKGSYRISTGEISVILDNNASVDDIGNTIVHESLGHDGIRILFPTEELLNNALDELYDASNNAIRAEIDAEAEKYTQAEAERLMRDDDFNTEFEDVVKEHGDMAGDKSAYAYAKASKNARRKATEEYGARVAGKVGDEGFEKMTRDEQTFWGKLKSLLEQALDNLMRGLKIPKMRKWNDKQWAYVYYKAWKAKRAGAKRTPLDIAEDVVMRENWFKSLFGKKKKSETELEYDQNDVTLQHGNKSEQNNGVRFGTEGTDAGGRMAADATRRLAVNRGRGDIRMYEEGLGTSHNEYSEYSERNRRETESERLVGIAKTNGQYKSRAELASLGKKYPKGTGESEVYIDHENRRVYKSKDPYAKSPMKGGIQPEDVIYEHIVHNMYFPETEYRFEGISDEFGDVRIVLSQGYVESVGLPTKKQIDAALARRGLYPVDNYTYGNDEITVTDVTGDNAVLGADGEVYFIDPIINFRKPIKEILDVDNDVMQRPNDDVMTKDPVFARAMYERSVATSSYQMREAMQDSMLGLLEAYKAIEKASGRKRYIEDIAGPENAYLWENRLSSKNKAEQDAYRKLVIKPMLDEVAKLAPDSEGRDKLTRYMMAKHGLERNILMRDRAITNGMDPAKAAEKDFSGLTGLASDAIGGVVDTPTAEAWAENEVLSYENANKTDALWASVNAATKATLSKLKEGGLLSQDTHDNIASMYENYIPLRGWAETTADEVYGYLSRNDGSIRGNVLKKANGRTSIADDPIATIAMMGQQAIAQSNRNKMKQAFFNYVRRNPSDLVSVNRLWLKYDDASNEWLPAIPDGPREILEGDDANTVARKWSEHEQHMEGLAKAEPDKYKRGRQARGIPFKMGNGVLSEHTVIVKCGDDTYVMTINGNPRAAQALNGLTNPDVGTGIGAAFFGIGEKINHFIAPIYTTRNPDFMVGNFLRDALYTNTMTWVKESPKYAAKFNANFVRINPIGIGKLVALYNANKLDMSNSLQKHFRDFMLNGGETGYTNQQNIEKHKKQVKKMLKRANGKLTFGRVMDILGEKWDMLNSASENCARFSAYLTSREMGRSIDRAIYDAKEISVNFNKKGAGATFMGATGQSVAGNAAAFTSGTGRGLYVFWNAVVQASTNFFRNAKRNPIKFSGAMSAMFALGILQAILGASDDDDNDGEDDRNNYFNQPDYVRRSNILFRVGDQYLAHPLPHEYLTVFGAGELAATIMMGKEQMNGFEIAGELTHLVSEFSPVKMEGAGVKHSFIPSSVKPLAEAYMNESWTGLPIYKENPFNEKMPEWTKAYSSANHQLVNLAEAIHRGTGGDKYSKKGIDFNPARVEYMLNGYFGGYFKIVDKAAKVTETITGDRDFEWRNMPLVNRVVKQGDERTAGRSINNDFYEFLNEYEDVKHRIRNYEREVDKGILGYAQRLAKLSQTPEFRRYWIMDGYQKDLEAIRAEIKEASTPKELDALEKEQLELRKEIVRKLKGERPLQPFDTTGISQEQQYYQSLDR